MSSNKGITLVVLVITIILLLILSGTAVYVGNNTMQNAKEDRFAKQLQEIRGLEARNTTLGYMQRGGTPTAFDRVLSTKYGTAAMRMAFEEKFGN